jgi:hypothetical protein
MVSQNAALAGVPAALVTSTIETATLVAAGGAAAAIVSTEVAAVTEGLLKAMLMSKLRIAVGSVLALVIFCTGVSGQALLALAEPPKAAPPLAGQGQPAIPAADEWASRLLAEKFAETQKLIKPQPGESRWREIPWQTSLWEARQLAAAEAKPIFLWFGSGGSPACHT